MRKKERLVTGLGLATLAFILSYALMLCFDPVNFPIRSIIFEGEQSVLSLEDLQKAIINEIHPGFFKIKVSDLQNRLLLLPWINQVDVRKRWPNKLVIKFDEHIPVARWGEDGMISSVGQVFFPTEPLSQFNTLPYLQGPSLKSAFVWEQYLAMKAILDADGLQISQLTLAPRGAWYVKLSNGMGVNLGTDDIIKRLKRFVRVYKTHLQHRAQDIAYVDLRYTSGLAVGWKTG